jgi:hypothetical protein
MAGKHDEVFFLGEEEVGSDPWSAPEEAPTASAPLPSRSSCLRLSWPLILGVLVLVVALVSFARLHSDAADPERPRTNVPALLTTPEAVPIARASREPDRPHQEPEREPQRPRSGDGRKAAEQPEEPLAEPLVESASGSAITYAPAPQAAPEPAPEGSLAPPAQAAPLPAARPEFGIER